MLPLLEVDERCERRAARLAPLDRATHLLARDLWFDCLLLSPESHMQSIDRHGTRPHGSRIASYFNSNEKKLVHCMPGWGFAADRGWGDSHNQRTPW